MHWLNVRSVPTWAIICTLALAQLAVATTATAQNRAGQNRNGQAPGNQAFQQQRPPFIKLVGKVTNLQQGAIGIDTDDRRSYIVQLHPQQTRVTVVGEGTVDALQPGVLVQFESVLNPQLTLAKAPVEKLMILTPSARTAPGVISDTPKDRTKPFTVRGKISRVIGSKLTVAATRKQVRVELAEEASVEIEVSDFSLVANGDKIEVKGAEVNPGLVHATDIKITLSKPLGQVEPDDGESADDETEARAAKKGKSRDRKPATKKRRSES